MPRIPFRSLVYWLPTGIILTTHFYTLNVVSGRSMQPTLNPDSSVGRDVALFDRFSIHTLQRYNREDIVALRSPYDPNRLLIKRIVALPGDRVKTRSPYPITEVSVPEGHVWVEGDEPFRTDDSNTFGPIPLALIDSKLVSVVWPLSRFGHLFDSAPNPIDSNDAARRRKRRSRVQTME